MKFPRFDPSRYSEEQLLGVVVGWGSCGSSTEALTALAANYPEKSPRSTCAASSIAGFSGPRNLPTSTKQKKELRLSSHYSCVALPEVAFHAACCLLAPL